jgi:hypothetical protein
MEILKDDLLQKVLEADTYFESRIEYMKRIQSEGFTVYLPAPNELLIDIDTEESYELFLRVVGRMEDEFQAPLGIKETISKSGPPHRHIIVTVPFELSNTQRIAFQAVLGSDLTRELLSLFRDLKGDPCPTLLAMRD